MFCGVSRMSLDEGMDVEPGQLRIPAIVNSDSTRW
jgi:hypothetical protein